MMKKPGIIFFALISFLAAMPGFSQACLPEGITFTTQSQIDSFAINYPGCKQIEGDLIIDADSSITNLNGLNIITCVGGHLSLGITNSSNEPEGCQNLSDISGLSNLDSIGKSLLIKGKNKLKNFEGLGNLETITWSILIEENDSIINLEGLEKLNHLYGLAAIGNKSLVNFRGLESITILGGDIIIGEYDPLNMYYRGNPKLINMEGLDNLQEVAGSFEVKGNNSLIDFSGLESLSSVERLEIISNLELQSLKGLDNLQLINGDLWISVNFKLLNILELENLDPSGITNILITNNFLLSTCQAHSICSYLITPNASIGIWDNAEGCNTKEEILELCSSDVIENTHDYNLKIYPNPTSEVLFIESSEGLESVCVLDSRGVALEHWNAGTLEHGEGGQVVGWSGGRVEVPVKGLAPGLYLVRVVTAGGVVARKVVVGR